MVGLNLQRGSSTVGRSRGKNKIASLVDFLFLVGLEVSDRGYSNPGKVAINVRSATTLYCIRPTLRADPPFRSCQISASHEIWNIQFYVLPGDNLSILWDEMSYSMGSKKDILPRMPEFARSEFGTLRPRSQ
jgi:hypothetical protein